MRKHILFIIVVFMSLISSAQVPVNSPSKGSEVWYYIKGQRSGGWATAKQDKSKVLHEALARTDAQKWKVVASGTAVFLVNKKDGTYLNSDGTGDIGTVAKKPKNPLTIKLYEDQLGGAVTLYNTGFRLHDGGSPAGWYNYNFVSDNCSFIFVPASYSQAKFDLHMAILDAKTVNITSAAGAAVGQYPQAAKNLLATKIATAQGVLNLSTSVDTDANNARAALETDLDNFYKTYIHPFKISTSASPKWYRIKNATNDNTKYHYNKVIHLNGTTELPNFTWKTPNACSNQLFRFVHIAATTKVGIICALDDSKEMLETTSPISYGTLNNTAWMIKILADAGNGEQYELISNNGKILHLAGTNTELVSWNADPAYNSASSFIFEEVTLANLITSAKATLASNPVGTNPGEPAVAVREALQVAIDTAEGAIAPAAIETAFNSLLAASDTFLASLNLFKYSNGTSTTWYAISTPGRASNNYIKENGFNEDLIGAPFVASSAMLWKVVGSNPNNVQIISKLSGGQIEKVNEFYTHSKLVSTTQERSIVALGQAQFNINGGGASVHMSGERLVEWNDGLNTASAWKFEEITLASLITATEATLNSSPLGTNPGEYPVTARDALQAKVDLAKAASSVAEVNAAFTDLLTASDTFLASINKIALSSVAVATWYNIVSAGSQSYAAAKAMVANTTAEDAKVNFETKVSTDHDQQWSFEAATGAKIKIKNRATGLYFKSDPQLSSAAGEYNKISLGSAQFSFNVINKSPLHAQDFGSEIVTWGGGLNSSSSWKLEEVETTITSTASLPATLNSNSKVTVASTGNISIDNNTNINSLSIEAGGKVTNNTGKTLTLGSLTIAANQTASGSYIDYGTSNITTATYNQTLPTQATRTWWYMASPVSATTSTVFGANKVGEYYEAISQYSSPLAIGTPLTKGKGYVVKMDATEASTAKAYSFAGTLNNGNVTINLTRTGTTQGKRGFNLIGNPYPSYLNWELVYNANQTNNLRSTIWYRTGTGTSMSFETYNATMGITVPSSASGNIPPMQAFWAKVDADAVLPATVSTGTINLTNAMRSHGDELTNSPLKARASTDRQIIRLAVSNGTVSDETVIASHSSASNSFDKYDSEKMTNSDVNRPEIFSLIGSQELVINGVSEFVDGSQFALGLRPGVAGNFTISLLSFTSPNDMELILRDNIDNIDWVLTSESPYIFSSSDQATNTRFSLLYRSKGSITTTNNISTLKFTAFENKNGGITVVTNNGASKIKVYSLMGMELINTNTTGVVTVINQKLNPGMYMVKLNDETLKVRIN